MKRFFAALLMSCTLVTASAIPCLAAESETETAAAAEASTESVSEELAEEETELATEAAVTTQEDSFKQTASLLIQQIVAMSDEQIAALLEQDDAFTTSALTSWQSIKDEVGALVAVGEQTVELNDTEVVITSNVEFESHTVTVVLYGDMKQGTYTSMSFDVNYTMAQKMEQAALNTIMGIAIVFLMLLFLSFLISQFKHVAKLEKKLTKTEAPAPKPAAPAVPAPAPAVEEEELSDDEELVAVIAAAIAAYEGSASTDGFVVRSIKKSNKNKWRRA
ncbi:MAG: OadG family transporter subunit [Eubacteriales bacterium]|nr:OadG family transporter subunit [Eubacteriales bacterium]